MSFLTPDQAIKKINYLTKYHVDEKCFHNYWQNSKEIASTKVSNRWRIVESSLEKWVNLRNQRIVELSIKDYEECFEFALELTYSGLSKHGLSGQRSEMQVVDNVINGILVERSLKYFLSKRFNIEIVPDWDVHPDHITPQDIVGVTENGVQKKPSIFVGVKGSKLKNAYLIADEHGMPGRSADVYIFGRVNLASDHLFRYLSEHSFFAEVKKKMEVNPAYYKQILTPLRDLYVWICGYVKAGELEQVTEIPGQDFEGRIKFVKSVANLKNNDEDWNMFCKDLSPNVR